MTYISRESDTEIQVADLGHCIARAVRDFSIHTAPLTIVSPADFNESGGFAPAQSITLWRMQDVIALRDLLDWALRYKETP